MSTRGPLTVTKYEIIGRNFKGALSPNFSNLTKNREKFCL